jgi:anti-sigma factor RsiW
MTRLSDELLLAYVDGQLDKPQASAVSQLVRDDYDVSQRVKRFQHTQSRLMDGFSAILRTHQAQPIERAVDLAELPARDGFIAKNFMSLAAAAIAVVIAVGYASLGPEEPVPSLKSAERLDTPSATIWQTEVATLHSFLSRDTLAGPDLTPANRDVVAMQLGRFIRRTKPITPPDFTKHGLKLTRAQVLNFQGQRFMQLAYMGAEDQPVALYIMAGGADARMSEMARGDVKTVSWTADGASFVLAGFLPADSVRALAVVAQNQIDG